MGGGRVGGGRVGGGRVGGGRVGGGRVATKWRATARSSLKTAIWHPLVSFAPPDITQSS